jgi:hypothetical protein
MDDISPFDLLAKLLVEPRSNYMTHIIYQCRGRRITSGQLVRRFLPIEKWHLSRIGQDGHRDDLINIMDRRRFLPVLARRAQAFLYKEASLVRYESFLNLW